MGAGVGSLVRICKRLQSYKSFIEFKNFSPNTLRKIARYTRFKYPIFFTPFFKKQTLFLIQPASEIKLIVQKTFFLRRARKSLLTKRFFFSNSLFKRNKNNPVMFVRAPKHFKSGKQHVFFFEGVRRKVYILPGKLFGHFLLAIKPYTLYNICTQINPKISPEIKDTRITLKFNAIMKYI